MAWYRTRFSDRDRKTKLVHFTDLMNVENQGEELFPEEFADGAYGAPEIDGEGSRPVTLRTGGVFKPSLRRGGKGG